MVPLRFVSEQLGAQVDWDGATYTAMISAMFPALGSFLSHVFLKEKMKRYQMAGFLVSICAMALMGWTPGGSQVENLPLGILCALLCVCGWAVEVVICAYGMKDPNVNNEHALMIRQITSAVFYGLVIMNVIRGWNIAGEVLPTTATPVILASAFFGTASYLCYYKAIRDLGPSKGMALNITYSVWSIPAAFVLTGAVPDVRSVLFGLIILAGSLVAATDIREVFGVRRA